MPAAMRFPIPAAGISAVTLISLFFPEIITQVKKFEHVIYGKDGKGPHFL
jgi:hypothetical protein